MPISPDSTTPTPRDAELARDSRQALSRFLEGDRASSVRIRIAGDTDVVLPAPALRLLDQILGEMAKGNAVTLVPHHAELTTQQAADVLNVSRPHLVKLLEEGAIPHHKVGTHRRVRLEDVLAYKHAIDAKRLETLRELAELSQELGLDE